MSIDDPNHSDRRRASTQVFVAAAALDSPGLLELPDDTEHHLARVLRLREGEVVVVADGAGRWRLSVITGAGLEPTSDVVMTPRPKPSITIAAAIPKGDRLDWMVQKLTEVGVDRLRLLHCDHSTVRWKPDRVDKQMVRLRRVALEAARQSRRLWLPEFDAPIAAADILDGAVVAEPDGREMSSGDTSLAIGPEGGWSESELELANDRVSLGDNVLRIETAAITAAVLCQAANRSSVADDVRLP